MKYAIPINCDIKNIRLKNLKEFGVDFDVIMDDWEPDSLADEQVITKLKNRIFSLESALKTVREEGFHAGFQKGKKTAEDEFHEKEESDKTEFNRIIESLQNQFQEAINKMEVPILRLAIKVARKIIGNQIKQSSDQNKFLKNQIQRFLDVISEQGKITIFVNPLQLSWINHQHQTENSTITGNIIFKSNTNLKPGECLLETEDYIIDGTIGGQLDRIEKQLFSQYDVE